MSSQRQQRPARTIPDALDPGETVALERPWLPRAGILAILAGVLPVLGLLLQRIASAGISNDITPIKSVAQSLTVYGNGPVAGGLRGGQADIAAHYGDHWILIALGGIASGLGAVLMAPVLFLLLRSAWRRRPSFPRWFFWAPLIGGLAFGIGSAVGITYQAVHFHDFAQLPLAQQTNGAANDALLSRNDLTALNFVTVIGQLFVAVGLGAASLSAMNVGLITRVIGSIGVLLAVLVILPLIQQQDVLRAFWLIALGFTLLGRWPGGRPQAWESGEPRPWPSRAQLMEAAERARAAQAGSTAGDVAGGADDAPAPKPKAGGSGRRRRK